MEQGRSSEAYSHSYSQEIPGSLWKPKVYYCFQKGSPIFSVLIHMHPVHILPPAFPKIHFNIIFPSRSTYSECPLPFRFSHQNIRTTCSVHLILLDWITLIIFGEAYEGVSRSSRTGHLKRESEMVQLSASMCCCIVFCESV